jgi:uncharacterized protein
MFSKLDCQVHDQQDTPPGQAVQEYPRNKLPALGVGMVYWPTLDPLLLAPDSPIDLIEVEPQTLWHKVADPQAPYVVDDNVLQHLRSLPQAKILHSVGLPVGGQCLPNPEQLPLLSRFSQEIGAIWASEHLSFNRVNSLDFSWDTGFLLPPLQNQSGAKAAIVNIQRLQSHLNIPLLVETGVNYLQPQTWEWSDGEFVATVATTADCGILLDLHNIWTNQRNGRQSVAEFLSQLPLERVVEMHVAGGEEYAGYWLDAHNGLVQPELIELARWVVPQLPNLRAIIFEVSPLLIEKVGLDPIRQQLVELQNIWALRQQSNILPQRVVGQQPKNNFDDITIDQWTETLGLMTTRQVSAQSDLERKLAQDPGVRILQHLISSARSGTVVNALPWTSELLFMHIGGPSYQQLFQDFWQVSPPRMFGIEEAADFANYLQSCDLDIPYLSDILTYEQAQIRSAYQDREVAINCQADPLLIIQALAAGEIPENLDASGYQLLVSMN